MRLKGLIRGLSTFPVGSHVRLNSLEIARIVATNPAFPLRPIIEIVVGPRGERLSAPRRVDLSTNTLLYVTEACSGKTMPSARTSPPNTGGHRYGVFAVECHDRPDRLQGHS